MNGENNHVFHSPALEKNEPGHDAHAWRWIVLAQLAMLMGFIGMSLVAIAMRVFLRDGDTYVATLGISGLLLTALALRGLLRAIRHAEAEVGQRAPAKVRTSPAAAQARITGMTPTL